MCMDFFGKENGNYDEDEKRRKKTPKASLEITHECGSVLVPHLTLPLGPQCSLAFTYFIDMTMYVFWKPEQQPGFLFHHILPGDLAWVALIHFPWSYCSKVSAKAHQFLIRLCESLHPKCLGCDLAHRKHPLSESLLVRERERSESAQNDLSKATSK